MQGDSERQKFFSRRAAMLAGGKAFLFSALVGRLYYLQIAESERYRTLADDNRINMRLLPPPRGRIVDRFGVPIAVNQQNYRAVIIPEQTRDVKKTLEALSYVISLGEGDKKRILKDIHRKRPFFPVTVRENLDWEEVARIEVNTPDLPGVMIDVGQSRYYLYPEETAHILGYVAAVSESEIGGDPLLELPGFRIGKNGIEKAYDLALRGAGGASRVEVNAYGRVIRELEREEGKTGHEIPLTIDIELQKKATKRLENESGAAVVIDIHSGDILAMASTPGFDPNAFNRGLDNDEWQALSTDAMSPLTNKTVAGQYAPGSTYKPVVALAALEKGAIGKDTRFFCSGSVKLGNAKFHCWKKGGHGSLDLKGAIEQSCDVYFYETAKRTGIDRIAEMSRRFGLGEKLGIDIPGEKKGLIPDDAWKRGAIGVPWQLGETLIVGIGQGYILATPLQLAVMTARLASGGVGVTPHLTRGVVGPDGIEPRPPGAFEPIGLVPEDLAVVLEGMNLVINGARGTARGSVIRKAGFEMAGKTGTVQVKRITKADRESGAYKNKNIPWEDKDHALFVGFAPVHAPRYAIAVVIEHGGGGSKAAAPVARDILLEAQKRSSARSVPLGQQAGDEGGDQQAGDQGSAQQGAQVIDPKPGSGIEG